MTNLIPVNILIADRTYRLKIEPKDEEKVRKTVKFINDKILEYKTSFAGKDMQDYISMALLWFATDQSYGTTNSVEMADLTQKLQALESIVDKAFEGA